MNPSTWQYRFYFDSFFQEAVFFTFRLAFAGGRKPKRTLQLYSADGDGKRVKKVVPSTGETTVFIYDASGKLVAEYSTLVTPQQDAKVSYLTTDHLGSPRITTDENGQVISRRDFQPFGEETVTPERTVTLGYQADDIRQKFTSYERDIETDLDFAQTRYYDFGFGRFSSPDSFLNDSTQLDPASWNLYAYVRNNPLNLTDPSGEAILVGKKLDADKRKALLERLNYTYGCSNCVTIDDNGYLQVDTSGLSEEVKKATNYITEAINKPANDFLALVFIKNGSSEVNFAGAGTAKDKSGKVYNAIFLDFDDYKNLKGDEDAKKAFEYTSFAHELAHLYPPPGADDPQPSFAGKERGPVVNAVNEILYATGRILRANYYVDNSAQYQRVVTFGVAKTDDDGKVVKGKDGIEVKADSKKIAWWNSQRIKGIN